MNTIQVKNTIPSEVKRDSILSIYADSVTRLTHGFHKYPAKFIPQIPEWAIERYARPADGAFILEPFCGSGTTLVEASVHGIPSLGIDIDGLSVLISKVKTTPLNLDLLSRITTWLRQSLSDAANPLFVPECQTLDHWFPAESIRHLSIIRTLIDSVEDVFGNAPEVRDIYDFLIICFSSIIRKVSYADDESQKTYVSHTKVKNPPTVFPTFLRQLDYYAERIAQYSSIKNLAHAQVIRHSSSQPIEALLLGRKATLAITSPPYIKAIDYVYNQMVELFWVGDIFEMQTQVKQNVKKRDYIGNKQIPINEYRGFNPQEPHFGIQELDDNISKVYLTDSKNGFKHSYVAYKYFLEMDRHFDSMGSCLADGGHYVMVVGDSDVSKIHFNTATFLSAIAERHGFSLRNRWGYEIKNRFMRFDRGERGGKIDIDWVLDFQR